MGTHWRKCFKLVVLLTLESQAKLVIYYWYINRTLGKLTPCSILANLGHWQVSDFNLDNRAVKKVQEMLKFHLHAVKTS